MSLSPDLEEKLKRFQERNPPPPERQKRDHKEIIVHAMVAAHELLEHVRPQIDLATLASARLGYKQKVEHLEGLIYDLGGMKDKL